MPDSCRRLRLPFRALAIAAATTVSATSTSSCGDAPIDTIGMTAVTITRTGHPVVLFRVCRSAVDTIEIVEADGSDDEPDYVVGSWTLGEPVTGARSFEIDDPGSRWMADRSAELVPGTRYTAVALRSEPDERTESVSFYLDRLTTIRSDQVLVGDNVLIPRKDFTAATCPPPA